MVSNIGDMIGPQFRHDEFLADLHASRRANIA